MLKRLYSPRKCCAVARTRIREFQVLRESSRLTWICLFHFLNSFLVQINDKFKLPNIYYVLANSFLSFSANFQTSVGFLGNFIGKIVNSPEHREGYISGKSWISLMPSCSTREIHAGIALSLSLSFSLSLSHSFFLPLISTPSFRYHPSSNCGEFYNYKHIINLSGNIKT